MNPFAVEIDTKLAEAHGRLADADQRRSWAADTLHRNAGHKRSRDGRWSGTLTEAASYNLKSENAGDARDLKVYQESVQTRAAISAEVDALNAQYTGWSRFFLVTNTNGHIHRSMNCSTCYVTTTYAWFPTLSGRTEAEAVADQGEILCSVCFPSAPVAWTTGVSKASTEARGSRAAKSAALAAKKAEKALGTVLRVGRWNDRIETIHAAKAFLTDAAEWNTDGNEHPSYPAADVALVAEALAARVGTTAAEEIAAAAKRAEKRNR